jgi:hypothetical protein
VKCAIYGAIAARAAGVPAVVNAVAGMGYVFASDRMLARTLRPMVKLLMRGTLGGKQSRLILQNPDDADAFVRARLVPEHHIRVIRSSGVNLERFLPVVPVAEPRPLRVLLAARLLWGEGHSANTSRPRACLRAQGRNIEFVIAGSPDPGNPRSVSREQVESWVAEGLVDWRGHVEDMPVLMRSMDVIALPRLLPRRRAQEPDRSGGLRPGGDHHQPAGLPRSRQRTRRGRPARGAALCAFRSPERIAQLDDDRPLVRRLGDSARRKAMEHFDEQMVHPVAPSEVYDELLPPRHASRARARAA